MGVVMTVRLGCTGRAGWKGKVMRIGADAPRKGRCIRPTCSVFSRAISGKRPGAKQSERRCLVVDSWAEFFVVGVEMWVALPKRSE